MGEGSLWSIGFWQKVLLVTLTILLIIVFYKWLLRYLRRNSIKKKFAFLHPFQSSRVSGKSQSLKLELPYQSQVFCVCRNGSHEETIFDGELPAGTHELEWDVSSFSNGTCHVEVQMPDQKITRQIEVVSQ